MTIWSWLTAWSINLCSWLSLNRLSSFGLPNYIATFTLFPFSPLTASLARGSLARLTNTFKSLKIYPIWEITSYLSVLESKAFSWSLVTLTNLALTFKNLGTLCRVHFFYSVCVCQYSECFKYTLFFALCYCLFLCSQTANLPKLYKRSSHVCPTFK